MKLFTTLSLLVFMILINSCTTTYEMRAKGEHFDALSKITSSSKQSIQPSGGHNGKNLVFTSRENDGSYNIYMKNKINAQAVIQKSSGVNFNLAPSYCPQSERIVFQYYNRNNFDIYYIDAFKGKAITQITNSPGNEYNPSWSKDGKIIVFEKGASPKFYVKAKKSFKGAVSYEGVSVTKNQIWLKNLESGELKMIGEGSFPEISPNGQEIAFVKYDINHKNDETGTIWIMSIDGGLARQITNSNLGYASSPSWSPNGDYITFQLSKDNKDDADVYTISTYGEELRQHTTNESNDFAPYWSEGGDIYFSSDRGGEKGNYQIWRFKVNM